MSETPQTPTPESPTPEPTAPAAVPVARTPLRERFHGTAPALLVFVGGALFGALLTGGVVVLADDDDHRGPGVEMRFEGGPGGGDQFGGRMQGGPGGGFGR
jgi:hypothetical protein